MEMDDLDEEVTAWHEAGHATMAVLQGGYVERVTIEPPWDDGPHRYGDTVARWSGLAPAELLRAEMYVSLAGPVVEMLYRDERFPIDRVAEWSADWQRAVSAATQGSPRPALVQASLAQCEADLFDMFETENYWAAAGAVADELLAHQTLEHEQVAAALGFWQRR